MFVCSSFLYSKDAYAFSKSGAVNYADNFALSTNISYFPAFNSNCANFVSQVMHEGGGLPTNGSWYYHNFTNYSATWSVADELKNHIASHGIGTKIGSWSKEGSPSPYVTYAYVGNSNNLAGGDEVIFYDWNKDGIMDHTSFCVRTGTDPKSHIYGDLINQNTKDRKNAIWHLDPYNPQASETRVYAFRLY